MCCTVEDTLRKARAEATKAVLVNSGVRRLMWDAGDVLMTRLSNWP